MLKRLRRDLADALMLLTRLPASRLRGDSEPGDPAAAVWAYPLVGLLVGGIGALVDWTARRLGMPPLLAAVWTLAAMVAVTGGLHEDGLADTADGFGGGRDKAAKLAIMRDSRIGTFGVLALGLALAARGASIAALADPTRALLAAGVTGRTAVIVLLRVLRPARADGLAAGLRNTGWRPACGGIGMALAIDWLLLPQSAWLVVVGAAAGTLALAHLARGQVGGYTGDVLGAGEQVAEVLVLSLAGDA